VKNTVRMVSEKSEDELLEEGTKIHSHVPKRPKLDKGNLPKPHLEGRSSQLVTCKVPSSHSSNIDMHEEIKSLIFFDIGDDKSDDEDDLDVEMKQKVFSSKTVCTFGGNTEDQNSTKMNHKDSQKSKVDEWILNAKLKFRSLKKKLGSQKEFEILALSYSQLIMYAEMDSTSPVHPIALRNNWSLDPNQLISDEFKNQDQLQFYEAFLLFTEKCRVFLDTLHYIEAPDPDGSLSHEMNLLAPVLHCCSALLVKFTFTFSSTKILLKVLGMIVRLRQNGKTLKNLNSLSLRSSTGEGILLKEVFLSIHTMNVEWQSFEFGDFIDSSALTSLVMLLDQSSLTLRSLMIHGGFISDRLHRKYIKLRIPVMPQLYMLSICPKDVEIRQVHSLKEKLLLPIALHFAENRKLESLKKLILGKCVNVEHVWFNVISPLETFKCSGPWNLCIPLPGYQTLLNFGIMPQVTSLQVPVQLDDVCFIGKVRQTFPFLKKIWLYLPSSQVLKSFFKHFMDSDVEKLVLKTQFPNKGALESCLFPELPKDWYEVKDIPDLRDMNKNFFCPKSVGIPLKQTHLEKSVLSSYEPGTHVGLRGLKKLRVFHVTHVPKIEEHFDDGSKEDIGEDRIVGFRRFPLSGMIHEFILGMQLDEFTCKNFQVTVHAPCPFYVLVCVIFFN
jgi:hypothetical protein